MTRNLRRSLPRVRLVVESLEGREGPSSLTDPLVLIVSFPPSVDGQFAEDQNAEIPARAAGGNGPVVTEAFRETLTNDADKIAEITSSVPLGRTGTPDDIAAAVVYLASDAASWVTGQLILVAGGLYAASLIFGRHGSLMARYLPRPHLQS